MAGRPSTKTDKSKLLHGSQSHIEPSLDWPCSAAHNFDGTGILHLKWNIVFRF